MDAATIAAIGAVMTPPALVVVAVIQLRATNRVHKEVRTLNEGTIGSFAAEDETRRIEALPRDQRSPTEQRHIDQAPPQEPPQGPGR